MPKTAIRINLDALRALVVLSGHSAASLAAACDPPLDRSTVSNILAGTRNPSADTTKRLTTGLNVPMTAVLADPEVAGS